MAETNSPRSNNAFPMHKTTNSHRCGENSMESDKNAWRTRLHSTNTDLSKAPFQDQTTNDGSRITFRENKNIHKNLSVETNFLCISHECRKTAYARTAMKWISHRSADGHCRSMIRFKEWYINYSQELVLGATMWQRTLNHFPSLKAFFHDQQAQIFSWWENWLRNGQ